MRVCSWKAPWWARKQVASSGYAWYREASIETKLEPGTYTVEVLRVCLLAIPGAGLMRDVTVCNGISLGGIEGCTRG